MLRDMFADNAVEVARKAFICDRGSLGQATSGMDPATSSRNGMAAYWGHPAMIRAACGLTKLLLTAGVFHRNQPGSKRLTN